MTDGSAACIILSAVESIDPAAVVVEDLAGRVWRSGDVLDHLGALMGAKEDAGIARDARVAVVLPHGAELALTTIAAMATGGCVPLNPRLTASEMAFAIADTGAAAMITTHVHDVAMRVARDAGIATIERLPDDFAVCERAQRTRAVLDDRPAALSLHTSGTTAQPKLVGLEERHLLHSARSVAAVLGLAAGDRGLSVMPLFHIHGIVAGLLASVVSGATVVCGAGFDAATFRADLARGACTWATAVPSMYQAVTRRPGRVDPIDTLRVLRSSSAPLQPSVVEAVEQRFERPLLNSYGMTEAAHQMASQTLAPGGGRTVGTAGTVGASAGADIAILDASGVVRLPGRRGEIVVRGGGVIDRYRAPASANETSHVDGWFRTGDDGELCADGSVVLHGRLKEIIDVAGEQVSPYEVEAVLLTHPGIADAVAFAVPDRLRGERVGVLVVPHASSDLHDAAHVRAFAREQLAAYKVPDRVVFGEQVPLGPTGKVQRRRLAAQLGLVDAD